MDTYMYTPRCINPTYYHNQCILQKKNRRTNPQRKPYRTKPHHQNSLSQIPPQKKTQKKRQTPPPPPPPTAKTLRTKNSYLV